MEIWDDSDVEQLNQQMIEKLKQEGQYKAIHDVPDTLKLLRNHKGKIMSEYLLFLQSNGLVTPPSYSSIDPLQKRVIDQSGNASWRTLHLRIMGMETKLASLFPETMTLINSLDEDCPTIMISLVDPGVNIKEHRGFYCGVLRYHLGIVVPEGAHITIDGQRREWKPDLFFDDTFIHSVSNPTSYTRIVLFLDVVRRIDDPNLDRLNRSLLNQAKVKSRRVREMVDRVDHLFSLCKPGKVI